MFTCNHELVLDNNAINSDSACSVLFELDGAVFDTKKNFRPRDALECSNVFLSAENSPRVLKAALSTLSNFLLRLDIVIAVLSTDF